MTHPPPLSPLIITVDAEHGRLRLAVVVMLIVSTVVAYWLFDQLIPSLGFNLIALVLALVSAALLVRLAEPLLKGFFPSRRRFHLDDSGARLSVADREEFVIRADQDASLLFWHFPIPRRARYPKGWFVLAAALEQTDSYLTLYTLASPEQAAALLEHGRSIQLQKDTTQKSGATTDSLRVVGEQRRLQKAEAQRWQGGAEMPAADFGAVVEHLLEHYPRWYA